MNITQLAIEKRVVTGVALVLVIFAGLSAYRTMSRAEDPGFIIRTAVVLTYFPGASPERVEQLVTDKLEKVIQEMPEIDFLGSQSKAGVSIIFVNIKESLTEMRPIWDSLRRKVDRAKADLPPDVIGPTVNDEFGDVFGTMITLTGDGYTYAELKEIADEARNELLRIPQVAKVDISGIQDERVFVEFNNARLAELGVSPAQLQQILAARNIVFPGGEVFTKDEQIVLEPSGNFESIEDLERTVISLPGRSQLLYLGDIAHVYRGYVDPPTTKVRYNGTPALVLAVSLREGGNIVALGEAVKEKIRRFRSAYPIGVDFDLLFFQTQFVDQKISAFVSNLIQAMAIVAAIMLIFLGFRTGLVIASLVPMTMVAALMVMGFLHIGLDQMSLAALIISLGLLVDNAIVMAESIMVQMKEGKPPVRAAIDSAGELRVPLLTSSLTTAAAFLPIYLAESAVGEYTAPIFEVVTITLLCSWILSLTMTPLLAVRFIKVKPGAEKVGPRGQRFYGFYRRFLLDALRHRGIVLLVAVVTFVGVMQLTRFVPQIFFPANDKAIMYTDLFLPVGTPLEKTERMVAQIEGYVRDNMMAEVDGKGAVVRHGVTSYASWIGAGPPRFYLSLTQEQPSPEYAYMLFHVTDRWRMEGDFIPKLERYLADNFPDLTSTVGPLLLGPPVEAPVQVRISGSGTDEVFDLADKVKAHLATLNGVKDIRDDWGPRTKKLFVHINQARAQRAGLTSQDVALSLQTVLSGIEVTDYREEDEVIPVVLRSVAADRKDIGKLESHNIYVQSTGRAVPLKQVADIEILFEPSKILRRDRLRTVTVNANILPGFNAIALSQEMDAWLAGESRQWPIGYRYEMGGEIESSGEANESIMAKLPIAGLIIILLLVVQFDSLRRPLIILLTIPLGLIGVILGLLITQEPLGFVAFLGVVALAGIVINNAIVLIDRIKIEIEQGGLDPRRAVIEASQRRLRPIFLTTATTIGGLIPLWLGGGPLFEAMAVAIIFGLAFATLLTLVIVPVLYSLFFRVSFKGWKYE